MFLGESDPDRTFSCPVLHGSLVGAVVDGETPREVAVLPFRYDPWDGRFE